MSRKRYNSQRPIGISPPGQHELRRNTMREEILRIPNILGWQCLFGASIVVFATLIAAIIGPVIGVAAGLGIIIYTARFIRWTDIQTRHLFAPIFIVLTILWLYTGYDICASIWIWNPIPRWHVSIKVIIVTFYSLAISAYSWAEYMLWVEETDPNHPSPRHASQRDNPHVPFITKETYGGQVLPVDAISSIPQSRTIRVEVANEDGSSIKYIDGIPDTPQWRAFAAHIARTGPKSFTENAAKSFKIKLDDQFADNILLIKGMRTVRTELIDRGLAKWNNADHGRGVTLKRPAMLMMETIGKLGEN